MGAHCAKREAVLADLRENVLRQCFVPKDGMPARGMAQGRHIELPAYVPYVGRHYFNSPVRILCYAINQNLSQHTRWTDDWTSRWAGDEPLAIDRLNAAALAGEALPIRPYAEGFMPLVAAMALKHAGANHDERMVDDLVAVTNFVKFSTSQDADSTSIPSSWWRECSSRYVKVELELLQPQVVVGFGQQTVRELTLLLKGFPIRERPRLLGCRFPGRIPSIKARPLVECEALLWDSQILPLAQRLRRSPIGSYHRWRMLRFPGYFCDTATSWGMAPLSANDASR